MRARSLRMDEWNHVGKPLLEQLRGPDWEIIDLTEAQRKPDAPREWLNCARSNLAQAKNRV